MDAQTIYAEANPAIPVPVTASREQRFEDLVLRYHAHLYRYARWLSGDTATAEDLLQEVFLRAWSALDTLRDDNAAKSWLITILRRENARRFERYRPEQSDVDMDMLPAQETASDRNTEYVVLRRAIAELSETYREPLLLQVLGGYRCEEIGDLLGLSPGVVMSRVFRARAKLRATLGEGVRRRLSAKRSEATSVA
jgi:RNA polymerase sigma-70 factor, ECF subfamily